MNARVSRSHLYVPADRPERFPGSLGRGADAIILDLEDAVPWPEKERARSAVREFLESGPETGGVEIWVRINAEAWEADLDAVVRPGLAGVCLAKTPGPEHVERAAALVDRLEAARGLRPGGISFSPLLEDAAAVLDVSRIAAAPRVLRLQVGEADLAAECGLEPGADAAELSWVRTMVVLASTAAGLQPPVGPVSTDFTDLDGLRQGTLALRRLGYRSRACIHPAQLAVVNAVFTPTPEEVERARVLVRRFAESGAEGSGVFVDQDGRMVDLAVVRAAERVLALAGS